MIPGRDWLDKRAAELAEQWPEGAEVPLPDFWGGFLVRPETVEFWQGRPDRLHDRLRYKRDANGAEGWSVERLSP